MWSSLYNAKHHPFDPKIVVRMLLFTWRLLFIISVIIDLRLQKIVTKVSAHSTAVNTIVINDTDNYFVSGAADGDIKVLMSLLSSFPHLFPSLLIFFPSTFISPGFHLLHIFPLFCLCSFFVLSAWSGMGPAHHSWALFIHWQACSHPSLPSWGRCVRHGVGPKWVAVFMWRRWHC